MKFLLHITLFVLCSSLGVQHVGGQLTASRDGKLDRSFGENGMAFASRYASIPQDLAILNDGSIVVVHQTIHNGKFVITLSKQLPDGNRDESFGKYGFRLYEFPTSISDLSLAVQPDGKFIVGGSSISLSNPADVDFFATRIDASGNIDTSFGNNGSIIKDFTPAGSGMVSRDLACAIILQPDGKIIIAGAVDQYIPGQARSSAYAVMVRTDQNGNIDPSFGNDGVSMVLSGSNQSNRGGPVKAKRLLNGKIVLGMSVERESSTSAGQYVGRAIVQRYNHDGTPDSSFAENGEKDISAYPKDAYHSFFVNFYELPTERIVILTTDGLIRLTSEGLYDDTFGQNGRTSLGPPVCYSIDLAVINDGRIVVNRSCTRPLPLNGYWWIGVIQKYWPDGTRDFKFGNTGESVIEAEQQDHFPGRMRVLQDGYLIVTGYRGLPGMSTPFIAKIHGKRKL
jgi:uncharacterized delta-60 repeat protein